MQTENEAKNKWCPFARVGVYHGGACTAVNRHPEPSVREDTKCIGSGCMAWRWKNGVTPEQAAKWEKPLKAEELKGYCGLAEGK